MQDTGEGEQTEATGHGGGGVAVWRHSGRRSLAAHRQGFGAPLRRVGVRRPDDGHAADAPGCPADVRRVLDARCLTAVQWVLAAGSLNAT